MKHVQWAATALYIVTSFSAEAMIERENKDGPAPRKTRGFRDVHGSVVEYYWGGNAFVYRTGWAPFYANTDPTVIAGSGVPETPAVAPDPAESASGSQEAPPAAPVPMKFRYYPPEFNNYFAKAPHIHPYHPTGVPPELQEAYLPASLQVRINVRVPREEGWRLVPSKVKQKAAERGITAENSTTYWIVQSNPWQDLVHEDGRIQPIVREERAHAWCTPNGVAAYHAAKNKKNSGSASAGDAHFDVEMAVFQSAAGDPRLENVQGAWVRSNVHVHNDAVNTASPANFNYTQGAEYGKDHAWWALIYNHTTQKAAVVLHWLLTPQTFDGLVTHLDCLGSPGHPADTPPDQIMPRPPVKMSLRTFGRHLEEWASTQFDTWVQERFRARIQENFRTWSKTAFQKWAAKDFLDWARKGFKESSRLGFKKWSEEGFAAWAQQGLDQWAQEDPANGAQERFRARAKRRFLALAQEDFKTWTLSPLMRTARRFWQERASASSTPEPATAGGPSGAPFADGE